MKKKSHFRFNKQERSGIFFLLLIIILLQGAYFLVKTSSTEQPSRFLVDNLDQSRLDSLRSQKQKESTVKMYPFDPNSITDHKGYILGITPDGLDRLYAFGKQGEYVDSATGFQQVTHIPYSLLKILSPYFKFPRWKNTPKVSRTETSSYTAKEIGIRDLNSITAEELNAIDGIGDKLSARIIKFRDGSGGFLMTNSCTMFMDWSRRLFSEP